MNIKDIENLMKKRNEYFENYFLVEFYMNKKYGKEAKNIDLEIELIKIWEKIRKFMGKVFDFEMLNELEELLLTRYNIITLIDKYERYNASL